MDAWGVEEGLPQSSVIAITQTQDGYLWLGTLNGLVRFDGVQFTVFDEGNTPELNSSRIVSLFEDGSGNLWIGTETAGVALARIETGIVRGVDLGRGGREGRLVAGCEDGAGAVWLYTADGQLCRVRDGHAEVWRLETPSARHGTVIPRSDGGILVGTDFSIFEIGPTAGLDSKALPLERETQFRQLDALVASRSGGYWRLADGRIQKWNEGRLEKDLGTYPWGNAAGVSSATEDRAGHLIVGTLGDGIFWFDETGKAQRLARGEGLSHNHILSLHVDHEGSLWIGTDGGGLNRVRRPMFEVLPESRGRVVQSLAEGPDGGIWIAAHSGGLSHWKDGVWRTFLNNLPVRDLPVRTVLVDREQRVWAGTWGFGLFRLEEGGEFQRVMGPPAIQRVVLSSFQDRNGLLWIGTREGLARWDGQRWKVFTTADGMSANIVHALVDDPEGNLWIGTEGGGLNRLRGDQFTVFRKSPEGLPGDDISSLYFDADGVLWVGTFGSGLARFHQEQWTRYTTEQGLASNGIGYIAEDREGFFWIGSNAGLFRVHKSMLNDFSSGAASTLSLRVYGARDGLPTRECTQGAQPGAIQSRDGRLWFPTVKGLASIDPAQIRTNPRPPPMILEAVLVEGQPQTQKSVRALPPSELRVPPGKERVEIQYTALNLTAPERTRFRYRLAGHESTWNEVGNARVARYSTLRPGTYRFELMASNEDGVWSDAPLVLPVIVEPPFWRTWWFLTATILVLVGAVVAVVHAISTQKLQAQLERMRQQEALEKERARIARDLHDQLGANLTQVALLGELVESDKDLPNEVEAHAQQISGMARETTRALDEIVWAANPSNDSLEGLVNYICKYAQEYLALAGIRYRLEAPSHLPDFEIAPDVRHNVFLAAKEAVNNLVRHAKASAAWIRLDVQPSQITLRIADDGQGLDGLDPVAAAQRNGLRNMRRRMEEVGGAFCIGPAPEGGTVVTLSAPVRAKAS